MNSDAIALYAFNIDKVRTGDILLTRVDFSLGDTSTYASKVIQRFTKSTFSHAALCIDYGMFIEAIGTGVCRLAIMATAAHKRENVRLLRLASSHVSDASAKAERAARIAQEYLLRGYSRRGAVGVEIAALRDPERTQLFCSQLVARSYEEAGQDLVPNKKSHEVGPGDLERSELLEDATDSAVFLLHTDSPPDFYLDDHTLFERPHHWEVATKLEILANAHVRKAYGRLNEHPASFWELEKILAKYRSRPLDDAIHRALEQHRFAETYLEKTRSIIPFDEQDMSLTIHDEVDPTHLDDRELLASIRHTQQTIGQLEKDVAHRQHEHDAYLAFESRTHLKTFPYLGHLQGKLLRLSKNGLAAKQKELAMLIEAAQARRLIHDVHA
jgi:hypothetical protein